MKEKQVWHFPWYGLASLVHLDGKLTANQYELILTDHLNPVMKHIYPDGCGHFQDDSSPSTVHESSPNNPSCIPVGDLI